MRGLKAFVARFFCDKALSMPLKRLNEEPDPRPEGYELRIHWPDTGDDEENESVEEHSKTEIERLLDEHLGVHFDLQWTDQGRPPQCGNHYDLILFLVGAATSGLAWDMMKRIAIGLSKVVTRSAELGLDLELDDAGLRYVALALAKRRNPHLWTMDELIRALPADGDDEDPVAWIGGPGVTIFLVPDLRAENTHVIVLKATGKLLDHWIGDWLPRTAREAKDASNLDWKLASDEEWSWS